jgi:regulator of sirC expression with transglutaminase-like and TPR domain
MTPDQRRARARFSEIASLADEAIDLGEASFLIAAEEYPGLDVCACLSELDAIARDLEPQVRGATGEVERIAVLAHYLHEVRGLRGNEEEYYDPRNSYLNEVLHRGVGIPISLSVVYLEVAKRLGIPLLGIGFPAHFLIKYDGSASAEVFIDPFNGGRLLTEGDCKQFLTRLTNGQVPFRRRYLLPMNNRQILGRMLNNLKGVYLRQRDFARALAAVDRLLLLSPELTREYRDRGAIHLQMEAFRLALLDFERYLREGPDAEDVEIITTTVEELRRRIDLFI